MSNSKEDPRSEQQTVDCEEDRNKRICVIGLQILGNTSYPTSVDINNQNYREDRMELLRKYVLEFENIKFTDTCTIIDNTFDGKIILTVKCDNCRKMRYTNENISLHSSADSEEDNQIGDPSYNQLQGEIESKSEKEIKVKSEEAKRSHKNSNNCDSQIASKQDEDSNSESGGDKGKKANTLFNASYAPISAILNTFNFVITFCKKRQHSPESITSETKDAAARCQKRQKQFDDCEDNTTEKMRVIGLSNLGNTCYFNSVLQNLLYLRPFRDQLIHTMTRTEYKLVPKKHPELETMEFASDKKAEPLTQELFNLIQETVYQSEATEETSKNLKCVKNTSRKIFTRKTIKPKAVQEKIVNKHMKFSDGSQQDSHELFRFLLDMVKDEEIKRLKAAFLKNFNIRDDKTQSMNCSVDEKNLKKYASEFENIFVFTGTFIDDTFGGKMISRVKCEGCDSILDVNEDFLDISLPLPENIPEYNILSSNPPQSEIESNSEGEEVEVKSKDVKRLNHMPKDYYSLEHYLKRFFSPIFLEEDYVCNNCNPQLVSKQDENDDSDSIDYDALKFTSANKQFRIKTVGPVLTIHLNRFSQTAYGLKKMNKRVVFPLVLDMSPFCASDTSVLKDCNNQILYGLRGIVDHLGGMLGGHYVAYVNIADWNVPSTISSSDSSKSRIAGKSSEKEILQTS